MESTSIGYRCPAWSPATMLGRHQGAPTAQQGIVLPQAKQA